MFSEPLQYRSEPGNAGMVNGNEEFCFRFPRERLGAVVMVVSVCLWIRENDLVPLVYYPSGAWLFLAPSYV